MKTLIRISTISTIIISTISTLLLIGWVKNIVKFVQLDFKSPYKAEVIRGVGLTSYGAIIGWINIKD